MKSLKGSFQTRRQREILIAELERVIDYSRRILVESKAEVRRIRRELATFLR
jgi:hypothetical protein